MTLIDIVGEFTTFIDRTQGPSAIGATIGVCIGFAILGMAASMLIVRLVPVRRSRLGKRCLRTLVGILPAPVPTLYLIGHVGFYARSGAVHRKEAHFPAVAAVIAIVQVGIALYYSRRIDS